MLNFGTIMNRNNCTVEQFNCSTLADTPNNSLYLKQAADPCDSEAIKMLQDEDSQGKRHISFFFWLESDWTSTYGIFYDWCQKLISALRGGWDFNGDNVTEKDASEVFLTN